MKEFAVNLWCDACFDEHDGLQTRADVTTPPMNLAGRGDGKTLDLCDMHMKALVTPLAELLANRVTGDPKPPPGWRKPTPTRPADARHERGCPVCGEVMHRASLVGHIWSIHRDDRRPTEPDHCPDCTYPPKGQDTSPQAIATHRRLKHGRDVLAEALAGVK